MSDKTIRTQLEKAGAPDYMILVVEHLTEGREELRVAMEAHNLREAELANERTILTEERAAFVRATQDMRELVNKVYGPESEISQINRRLDEIVADNHKRAEAMEERIANLERESANRIAL